MKIKVENWKLVSNNIPLLKMKKKSVQGVWYTPLTPLFGRQWQIELCEIEAGLDYIVISGPTKAIYWDPVSKKKEKLPIT